MKFYFHRRLILLLSAVLILILIIVGGTAAAVGTLTTGPIVITKLVPAVTTDATVRNISYFSADVAGEVTSAGGSDVTERGFVYSTDTSPTISSSKITAGAGTGSFGATLKNLSPGKKYFVRAYAKNSSGVGYGNETSFTTATIQLVPGTILDSAVKTPMVATDSLVRLMSPESVKVTGDVTFSASAITERGFVFSTSENPTISGTKVIQGSSTGNYNSIISGLTAGTTYYVRAYALSSNGVGYGANVSFTTPVPTPTPEDRRSAANIEFQQVAGQRMMSLQILKGKYPSDPLALNDHITRAELVTIIVRAFGEEGSAALLKGVPAFPDTGTHWASGYIAVAKKIIEDLGGNVGLPDGTFKPDKKLTPAEAVAFLMKFLGVGRDSTKSWPDDFLKPAVELGLITAGDGSYISGVASSNSTRGLVFFLYDRAFHSFNIGQGETFYTKYVDKALTRINVSSYNISGGTLLVEGTTDKDVLSLNINGTAALIVEGGNWTASVPWTPGTNKIVITALDVAGNRTQKTIIL